MNRNRIILYIIFLMVVFSPFLIIWNQTPSHKNLQKSKCFLSGFIEAKNGSQIEINLVWGNLFRPKQSHRDMGFDLVGVSCYFDHIKVDGRDLLPTNPLLNSAIAESLYHNRGRSCRNCFKYSGIVGLDKKGSGQAKQLKWLQ